MVVEGGSLQEAQKLTLRESQKGNKDPHGNLFLKTLEALEALEVQEVAAQEAQHPLAAETNVSVNQNRFLIKYFL